MSFVNTSFGRCGSHSVAAIQMGAKLVTKIARMFLRDESGASAAEYAVLLTLITVLLIGAVQFLGTAISTVLGTVATTLKSNA